MGSARVSSQAGSGVQVAVRRLPPVLRWLVWLGAAAVGSVVLGFLVGLARPRPKDPG